MKKKFIAMLTSLTMMLVLMVSASASEIVALETGVSHDLRVKEVQTEMQSAEAILGGECKLESEEIKRVGDYIVESRLYVLEDEALNAKSGGCGGVSSHTWRPWFKDEWDIKVLFGAFFYYNGETAICRPEESKFWAIRPNNSVLTANFNPEESYKDGSTATAKCGYARDEPGTSSDVEIFGTLKVTCTKDGTVGIESEVEHRY